jgi:hypothetical protein
MEHSTASKDPPVEEAKAEMVSPGNGKCYREWEKRQAPRRTQSQKKDTAWRRASGWK